MTNGDFVNTTTNNANWFNEHVYGFIQWLNDNNLMTAFALFLVFIAVVYYHFLPKLRKKK